MPGGVAGQYFLIQLIQLALGSIKDQKRGRVQRKAQVFPWTWTHAADTGTWKAGGGIWKLDASYGKLWVWSETECRLETYGTGCRFMLHAQ